MNERPAFADEWTTLSTRAKPYSFEEFVGEVETIVPKYVEQVAGPDEGVPPFLIIET